MTESYIGILNMSLFGGGWCLEIEGGRTLSLDGDLPVDVKKGERVRILGTIVKDVVSLDMTGPVLRVGSVTRLPQVASETTPG